MTSTGPAELAPPLRAASIRPRRREETPRQSGLAGGSSPARPRQESRHLASTVRRGLVDLAVVLPFPVTTSPLGPPIVRLSRARALAVLKGALRGAPAVHSPTASGTALGEMGVVVLAAGGQFLALPDGHFHEALPEPTRVGAIVILVLYLERRQDQVGGGRKDRRTGRESSTQSHRCKHHRRSSPG